MVTVMFVDIRGFTTFADRSTAREATDYLNEFFEVVVPVVLARRPRQQAARRRPARRLRRTGPLPDHADRRCGRAGDARPSSADGDRCRIGIGLNSGLVLVGTIGGSGYTELGVIGDPVNVAARVEAATRDLGERCC